jgi:hypothetical protein
VIEQREEARKSGTSGGGAGLDGFVDALEVVPSQILHGGTKNKASVTLPAFELVFLCGAEGATYNLEDVRGSASTAVVQADGNTDHDFGAQFPCCTSGHRSDQAAVGQIASPNLDRLKQAGKSATGADRLRETTLFKQHRIARVEVSGNNGGGDRQVFELTRIKETMNQIAKAVVAGQAKARHTPAAEITKANLGTLFDDAREREPAGVGGSQDTADTAAGDASERDALFLENLQNAQVGIAPSETASESQADSRAHVRLAGGDGDELRAECHEGKARKEAERQRWDGRSERAVQRYRRKRAEKQGERAVGSTEILVRYPPCTIVTHLAPRQFSRRNKQTPSPEGEHMQKGYEVWLGQAVVLKVELGDIQVPLRGKLLKENSDTVRMRIGEGWDVDIYKTMIRGVEEDGLAMVPA